MTDDLRRAIEEAWERRDSLSGDEPELRAAVEDSIMLLDSGEARVAEKDEGGWRVNQWLKKAVLLSFRLSPMEAIEGGPGGAHWWDKVPSKFAGWGPNRFAGAGFRAVPGAIVRRGAFIGRGAVL
ncbi:MAG TPA: 2,3,4,5-tetrahydropyridine-2,6-dicarboxylate N-succinyltransferase, partial [Allosphingosinicella sp.]|nr:2,3,4,5-tetrahydropyridine-2,6-dicarboxylate N-succinyltransferase [Allosphingosinicella sp.]